MGGATRWATKQELPHHHDAPPAHHFTMTSLDAERAQQPFQCPVCAKRFTRHVRWTLLNSQVRACVANCQQENLKRHSSVHSRVPGTLPCPHCPTTFARDDLRKRHIRRKHPPPPSNNAVVVAQPCESPVSEITSVGESSGRVGTEEVPIYDDTVDGLASQDTLLYGNTVDGLTSDELEHVLELYFDNVSPFVQFIHRSTFDRQTAFRPLVLGMACLGVQYAPVDKPSGLWFKEACSLLNSHDIQPGSPLWLPKIQALVLLELYAIMYACGNETIDGLRMHSKSVEVGSARGLAADIRWLDRRVFSTLCQPDQPSPLISTHSGATMCESRVTSALATPSTRWTRCSITCCPCLACFHIWRLATAFLGHPSCGPSRLLLAGHIGLSQMRSRNR